MRKTAACHVRDRGRTWSNRAILTAIAQEQANGEQLESIDVILRYSSSAATHVNFVKLSLEAGRIEHHGSSAGYRWWHRVQLDDDVANVFMPDRRC